MKMGRMKWKEGGEMRSDGGGTVEGRRNNGEKLMGRSREEEEEGRG